MSKHTALTDDTETPPEAATEAVETPEATEATDDGAEPTEGSEAARYRRRLRDTETERDALAGRLDRLQRAEVERLLTGRLLTPGDAWLLADGVGAFVDDSGDIDAGKLDAFVAATVEARPSWAAPPLPRLDLGQGYQRGDLPPTGAGWADVLRTSTD